MSRPSQLLVVALVYGWGNLMALGTDTELDLGAVVIGLATLLPVSASIHLANEHADFETDALTTRTPFSGGSGVLAETGLNRRVALMAAWIALVVGGSIAGASWAVGVLGPVALGLLAAGAFFGWMYSQPPLMLAWRGWGELDNALLGGLVLPLYGYAVLHGRLEGWAILATLPFMALVFVNLLATTWADRRADAQVGKGTLATHWPVQRLRRLYLIVASSGFLLLALLAVDVVPAPVALAGLLAAPLAAWGAATYTRQHNPFPSVAAMVALLLAQVIGWSAFLLGR